MGEYRIRITHNWSIIKSLVSPGTFTKATILNTASHSSFNP